MMQKLNVSVPRFVYELFPELKELGNEIYASDDGESKIWSALKNGELNPIKNTTVVYTMLIHWFQYIEETRKATGITPNDYNDKFEIALSLITILEETANLYFNNSNK